MKDALLATVIDEYATIEAFASVLVAEQKALCQVNPAEMLRPIVEKKIELVGKLATLEKIRDSQLAEMGLPGGWSGIELAAGRDPKLAAQWALLQQSAKRAKNPRREERPEDAVFGRVRASSQRQQQPQRQDFELSSPA